MSSLGCMDKQYYIMDGCGNYYRINGNNNLVVAGGREKAGIFSFVEANQHIGGGRKGHFYSAIPIEEYEDTDIEEIKDVALTITQSIHVMSNVEESCDSDKDAGSSYVDDTEDKMSLPYDMRGMDWGEYLTHFCYIASGIQNYLDELNQMLSDIDKRICDIMHYIELYNLDESDSVRMVEMLKECRVQRRDVKDEMSRLECFQRSIGTSSNVAKVKNSIKQMEKLHTRIYRPRKLQELFEHDPEEPIRKNMAVNAFRKGTCMNIGCQGYGRQDIHGDLRKEGESMEGTRRETIFDGKENDWKQFARQQAEFYANAEQYIYNLQADMKELDDEMERILREIEDANYNVAQGYKVFKRLKELRNKKKEKFTELECVRILTGGFDCQAMAEEMTDCVQEIEAVLTQPEDGDATNGQETLVS